MRKIVCIAALFCLTALIPISGNADTLCLDTSDNSNFTCHRLGCSETITTKDCLLITSQNKLCNDCFTHKLCCGKKVCTAAAGGSCDRDQILGLFLEVSKSDPAQLASIYVPNCTGQFVSLEQLFGESPVAKARSGD